MKASEFDEIEFFRAIDAGLVLHRPASASTRARLESVADRQLSAAEADAYLSAPMSEEEREELLALVRWFRRRYPTGAERLAYVRRAYARWRRE